MKDKMLFWILLILFSLLISCEGQNSQSKQLQSKNLTKNKIAQNEKKVTAEKPLIIFVELGSVRCIPCKQMQPIMESVEKRYEGKVKVVFHDVWTADGRKYAEDYGIRLIPTQVFLDKDGNEIFRHEGFFPEAEIEKFLQQQGLNPKDS